MAAGRGWPSALAGRELDGQRLHVPPLEPHTGVLILDESHAALPGPLLDHVDGPVHYLDLGGLRARSLRDLGGSDALWGGLTKLYASHSGLQSVDGVERLSGIRFLYLDHNALPEAELLRLPEVLPPGARLEALDLAGCPGCSAAVEAALLASGLLTHAQFLNGRRLHR